MLKGGKFDNSREEFRPLVISDRLTYGVDEALGAELVKFLAAPIGHAESSLVQRSKPMESTRNTSQSGLGQPQATQHSLPLLPRRVSLLRTFSHTSHQTHLGWLVSFAGGCSVILADEDADAGAADHGETPRANEGSEAWREGHLQGQSDEAPTDGEAQGFETRRENG